MAYYRDLREYLNALESGGKLRRISQPINKDTELYPLVRLQYRGLAESERTAYLFENVHGSRGDKYDMPVLVGALAGSTDIYSIGMQVPPEQIWLKLAEAEANPIPPRVVEQAPVQEVVYRGAELEASGGLAHFPIPVTTPGFDPAPYVTAPYWVTRDPDTGITNLGMYRAMVKAPLRTGINFAVPYRGAAVHLRKYRERGQAMPAALVIGGPPNLAYVAVSQYPLDVDELAVAGGIAGEPLELVKCRTLDLMVPAHAEIVFEGEVSTTEVEPEAPFGEAYGFVGPSDMNPYFTIKCITTRRNPIWLATVSQYPPSESSMIRQHANAGTVFKHLRRNLGITQVKSIGFFDRVGSARMGAISLENATPEIVTQAFAAAAERLPTVKIWIGVDADVNVSNLESVLLAVCMRTQPHRDYRIESFPAPSLGDYSLEPLDQLQTRSPEPGAPRPQASRLLIDATMKWPYPPISLPRREYMDTALKLWEELGLPPLTMEEPWWGANLGYWNEEHERHARAAAAGDYFLAGNDYAKQRRDAV